MRREYGLSEIVKLASNENPLGPSPQALKAVRVYLEELHRYPDGNGFELKTAIAAYHKVSPATITLGNGSNDVLELVARTFLNPDHEAVFAEHAFAVYPLVTQAVGSRARVAAANRPDHSQPYGHDLAAMAELINPHTRVVFIANPNNPTGTWLGREELLTFLESVPDHVLVVIDEAYSEYVEEPDYPDTIAWLETFPNLIVTRTFSKAYGLAGLRVGYALSYPAVADLLNRVRQPFNVNSLALAAAAAALGDHEFVARSRALNRAGLHQLRTACDELGLSYLPSAGNFLCVHMGRPGREIFTALLAQGVIVRPVDNYGLPDYLRITVGTAAENEFMVDALRGVLHS